MKFTDPKVEAIYKALDGLCDALELGHSEASTAQLFWILVDTFRGKSVAGMKATLKESYKEGLGYDMRGPIADGLLEIAENYK